jgi:hypothetical protein
MIFPSVAKDKILEQIMWQHFINIMNFIGTIHNLQGRIGVLAHQFWANHLLIIQYQEFWFL